MSVPFGSLGQDTTDTNDPFAEAEAKFAALRPKRVVNKTKRKLTIGCQSGPIDVTTCADKGERRVIGGCPVQPSADAPPRIIGTSSHGPG